MPKSGPPISATPAVSNSRLARSLALKPVSLIDMSAPISDDLRTAGERFVQTAKAVDLKFISESYGGPYTQTKKMYYPKVEYFLSHGQ